MQIDALLSAIPPGFVSNAVDRLALTLDGIPGDSHAGHTRKASAREPWHPRGALIKNDRQLSIISVEELAEIAAGLGLARLPAGWIGANMVVTGLPNLSRLAPMTRLIAASGATLAVTAYNAPCRQSGRAVAKRTGDPAHEFGFVKAAHGKRGLVAYVERAGEIIVGETLKVVAPRGPR